VPGRGRGPRNPDLAGATGEQRERSDEQATTRSGRRARLARGTRVLPEPLRRPPRFPQPALQSTGGGLNPPARSL